MLWLNRRASIAAQNSEGFATAAAMAPGHDHAAATDDSKSLPSFGLAIALIAGVLVCNFIFAELWIPTWQTDYLAEPRFGGVKVD